MSLSAAIRIAVDVLLIVLIWWGTQMTEVLRDVLSGLDAVVDHMGLFADSLDEQWGEP